MKCSLLGFTLRFESFNSLSELLFEQDKVFVACEAHDRVASDILLVFSGHDGGHFELMLRGLLFDAARLGDGLKQLASELGSASHVPEDAEVYFLIVAFEVFDAKAAVVHFPFLICWFNYLELCHLFVEGAGVRALLRGLCRSALKLDFVAVGVAGW
jgi:hypothetical protein